MSDRLFSAVIRIHGQGLNVSTIAGSVSIQPYRVDGHQCLHYSVREDAENWQALVDAVRTFLLQHRDDVERVFAAHGVEGGILDLAVSLDDEKAAQYLNFPSDLISLVAGLGLAVEISIYR